MRVAVYVLMAVSACGGGVFAPVLSAQDQAPNQPQAGASQDAGKAQDPTDPGQTPLTPAEQREQQIRQIDPLDRDDKDKKDQSNASRDAQKQRTEEEAPLPGSIAASEQNAAQRPGPQVVEDDDSSAPVQEYSGPAVLSRSYSISQPLIPQQLKWTESVNLSSVYDSGIARQVNPNGTLGAPSTLLGTTFGWAFSGRHYFRRDEVSVSYTGSLSEYSGYGAYNGINQTLGGTYAHSLSRRLTLNLSGTGSILSQSAVLENQPVGPETIANINISSSPNIQIYDLGVKQFSTQADLTWQLTSRLSVSAGTSYFAIDRDSAYLLGMTGQQARGDVNYRLTRKMTVGSYYSFNHYLFPHGFGNSNTNTAGLIYSYAFNRTTQLRFRGGLSEVQSLGLETVAISPPIAALLGVSSGIIDSAITYRTSDFSAQFIKDFGGRTSASLAYARGISPGNGVFQTSQQESVSASLTTRVFRTYSLTAGIGRDTLESVTQDIGKYQSVYGRLSLSRNYKRGIGANLSVEYRHFDLDILSELRNQLRITSGITWGSGSGRLWPF